MGNDCSTGMTGVSGMSNDCSTGVSEMGNDCSTGISE